MGVHGSIDTHIPRACSLPRRYMYIFYEQIGKPDYVNHGFQTEYKCKYPKIDLCSVYTWVCMDVYTPIYQAHVHFHADTCFMNRLESEIMLAICSKYIHGCAWKYRRPYITRMFTSTQIHVHIL